MDDTWAKNLSALASRNPEAARLLEQIEPHPHLNWSVAQHEEACVATVEDSATGRLALCSGYRPLAEAERFADRADLQAHGLTVSQFPRKFPSSPLTGLLVFYAIH